MRNLVFLEVETAHLQKKIGQRQGCRMDLARSIPPEERDRWRQGLTENMGIGDVAVDPGSKGAEKGMSWRVGSGVGSRDAAVDEQWSWIANVAGAVGQGLAGREEDDAGNVEQTD